MLHPVIIGILRSVLMPRSAPPQLMEAIRNKLLATLAAEVVELVDESPRHAGHREAAGRFHLSLHIVAARFEGMSRLERHRTIYETLAEELAGPVHALRVVAETPSEASHP